MSVERRGDPAALSAAEAGAVLSLPADVVRALADAGYLRPANAPGATPRFALGDLKAWQARLGDGGPAPATSAWGTALDRDLDPDDLLAVLDGRASEMADRTLELLTAVFPEASDLNDERRARFLDEARDRIEAILALCARGPSGDEPLELDLADIGADAANAGVPLPGILMTLRVTRDLVVQTAIEAAEARGGNWGLALAVTLTRVLPAIDRLTDAVARGYWEALVDIEAEGIDRYRVLVEEASDGIFEVDDDGIVRYANPAAAGLVTDVVGRPLTEVLGDVAVGETERATTIGGVPVVVRQFEQLRDGVAAGWVGLIRRI